jgi:hypothetical protein
MDIVYEIGARDKASPTLNKVESAMSRLERSTKDLGESAEKSLGRMSLGIGTLVKASGVLFVLDKAVQGISAAFSAVAEGVTAANAAAESMEKLSNAMAANGGASEEAIAKNLALSDTIERLMGVEAEQVQSLMTMAANLGTSNDALDDTAKTAIGLSEALGIGWEDALKKTREASQGSFGELEKLIPAMSSMATEEERLAAVIEVANKGLSQKQIAYQGAGGAVQRMTTRMGEFAEMIGGAISPLLETTANSISAIASTLMDIFAPALQSTGSAFTQWSKWIQEKITTAANAIIAGLTMAEVVFNNFGDVVEYVKSAIALRLETIRADFAQLFGVTLPAYGEWFVENFPKYFVDAFNAITTVIRNGAQKVANGFSALWDFVASRGEGGISGLTESMNKALSGSLLDGFKATAASLPDIAERALTEREQSLAAKMGGIGANLANEFATKFDERAIKLGEKVGGALGDDIDLKLQKTIAAADKMAEKSKDKLGDSSSALGGRGGDAILQASESRLLTRGPGERKDDPVTVLMSIDKNTAQSSEAMAKLQSEMAELKNTLANKGSVMFAGPPL